MIDERLRQAGHVAVRRDVAIPMRDGVRLMADIYGLGAAPRPVLVERTPYGKDRSDRSERCLGANAPTERAAIAAHYVEAGFAYVIQDCRGTGRSEGQFDKYVQEADDGEDTLAFIRAAAWCTGWIGLVGHSYGAACQIAVAGNAGSMIAAMVPDCGGFSNAYASGIRQGGAFDQKQATWAYTEALRELEARGDARSAGRLRGESVFDWLQRGPWSIDHTPLVDAPERQQALAAFWQTGTDGPFWRRPGLYMDPASDALRSIPAMFVSSWHDTSLRSTLDNFAGSSEASILVIGPWCHGDRHTSRAGDADFGQGAIPEFGLGKSLLALRTAWLSGQRDGTPPAIPRVRYFEMGGGTGQRAADGGIDCGGRWRAADQWPPADTTPLTLAVGDGRLLDAGSPQTPCVQSFLGDPANPVPTCGGAINSGAPVMSGGMYDQSPLFPTAVDGGRVRSLRADVLTLTSAPLTEDIHLCGDVTAELWVSTDAPDADVTIKLVDCFAEDGPALNLCDGILRLRYRESTTAPSAMPPGVPQRVVVEAFPVAALVRAGHRIRLDIAASNFPHFDSNPQTGAPEGQPGARRAARLNIHAGGAWPSALRLRTQAPA